VSSTAARAPGWRRDSASRAGSRGSWARADDVVLKPYEKGRPSMEAYLRWEEELDSEGRSPHELLPAGD
jgi:hypothetical protein